MFPITEQEFEDAYKKFGLPVTQYRWFDAECIREKTEFHLFKITKIHGCCPLGAKFCSYFDSLDESIEYYNSVSMANVYKKLNLTSVQVIGFMNGFDGHQYSLKGSTYVFSPEKYDEAYKFGEQMRRKFLPTKKVKD